MLIRPALGRMTASDPPTAAGRVVYETWGDLELLPD